MTEITCVIRYTCPGDHDVVAAYTDKKAADEAAGALSGKVPQYEKTCWSLYTITVPFNPSKGSLLKVVGAK